MHPDDALDFHIPPDLYRGPVWNHGILAGPKTWCIDTFKVDVLRSKADGSGVVVGVIDTGCDLNHPDLKSQVIASRSFVPGESVDDLNGHGTHCAGTIASIDPNIGMAPGAKLVIAKGLSNSGNGAGTWIAAAMRWCVEQGAAILSMSLGSSAADPNIQYACAELAAKGVLIFAAAGNSGGNTPNVDFPGRFPETISVAALASNLAVASFSNRGAKIDTSYGGVNIVSCRPGGGYQTMSGTSMATPGAAGVEALHLSGLKKMSGRTMPTVQKLRAMLAGSSLDVHTPGVDNRTGPGAIWPLLLANDLEADFPAVAP